MAGVSKKLRRLFVSLVVIVVLVIVADRLGNYTAERVAGSTIQRSQHLPSRPDVSIDDIPFLTQFASGNYRQVTITAHDAPVGLAGRKLDISRVRVVLHDVHLARNFSSVRAETAQASARIDYADLGRAVGLDVRFGGNGKIVAGKKLSILGQSVNASVSVTPKLVDGALRFGEPVIRGVGQLDDRIRSALDKAFDLRVPLDGIPFDVSVRSLSADSQGIEIGLTGANLSYSS